MIRTAVAGDAHIATLIDEFEAITLAEVSGAALMDRVDTKYLVPASSLGHVLQRLGTNYRVLEVRGTRLARYHTVYYDTPDLKMYHAHHNGRAPRYKVRVRSYGESSERFLEVKLKTNKARTSKRRVPLSPDAAPLAELVRDGLLGPAGFRVEDLTESVAIEYTRVTLVSRDDAERITLDLGLTITRQGTHTDPNGAASREFQNVVIAELKQRRECRSPFRAAMKDLGIRDVRISKYCVGIALLEPAAKRNMFKRTLGQLAAVSGGRSHEAS